MEKVIEVNVQSEIGKLNGVIIHTPGEEVENMTPENAERALYSDIINLSIAREEYKQIKGVLSKLTKTFEVKDLLCNILKDEKIKAEVLNRIEKIEPFIGEEAPKEFERTIDGRRCGKFIPYPHRRVEMVKII
ncbi:MAG: hypothetical protein ACLTXP_10280 [Odoribacter splanchnicus]